MIQGIFLFMHLNSGAGMCTLGVAWAGLWLCFSLALCPDLCVLTLSSSAAFLLSLTSAYHASLKNVGFSRTEDLAFWLGSWAITDWPSVTHTLQPRVGDWISLLRPTGGPKWKLGAFMTNPWEGTATSLAATHALVLRVHFQIYSTYN